MTCGVFFFVVFYAAVLVNIADSRRISCRLFGAGTQDPSLAGQLSSVLRR